MLHPSGPERAIQKIKIVSVNYPTGQLKFRVQAKQKAGALLQDEITFQDPATSSIDEIMFFVAPIITFVLWRLARAVIFSGITKKSRRPSIRARLCLYFSQFLWKGWPAQ